jgi:hypothetical protein
MSRFVVYSYNHGNMFFDTKEEAITWAKEKLCKEYIDEEYIAEIIPHKFKLIIE